ncbi:metallophosphatase [Photobacterium kishitanii]|uniref:Nuclease SbcCD subunit D n=1 Tax=Photobacterium kishitanii TaxID=318456 RepID=A0AAX0YYX3_9GAMM|nr:exonuclease SbcCD subunit D C-terminal domain-containing protein [Photobacterium kishitanii]KJG56402.1 metallophosphatase [Photobacterium kishitanii]KJG60264.1 metallophosphatase [Photobacterium kishitanii]KJG64518.1 metallophosphatase [Photobacterium kishitanii]KJG68703.1 metallophosphatase [Photobacterium kishitanii]PSU22077.1 exonuclease sbcCD subunit D [Photobacterium kishitanii]
MKIIHTSDWHLGHQLHGYNRDYEHQAFLDWLADELEQQQADALLVAGDIFDSANPPASAWRMLYRFLARLSKTLPKLDVVMIGGNHDSPSKLDAPHELLKAFDLHMVGGIHRFADGTLDVERMLVPLTNKEKQTVAYVLAVPFLRSADLRTDNLDDSDDRLIKGVEVLYSEMTQAARTLMNSEQAMIGMGHAYMASGKLSEMSERRVLGGNQHALPASIFADDMSYVALGHLHLAQKVAKKDHVRYSGSPIPLSMSERNYNHQIIAVEFDGNNVKAIEEISIPRCVDMLKVPTKPAPLDEVLAALKALPDDELPREQQPFLEVHVLLDKPQALLREKVLQALEDKSVRLAKITPHYSQREQQHGLQHRRLSEVSPQQVFALSWNKKFDGEPTEAMTEAFETLLTHVEEQEEER